ncbi:MAG TPA: hypothetical protein VJK02_20620 [Anaerolineales bacterium]|nr:hypothetical protein [Anaerolineales bacterium]
MARFLIEVPHENKKEACDRAVRVFMETGTHFMTNADWGCSDDVHKAWFTVDVESKEAARAILPSLFRQDAKIVALQRFRMEDLDETRGRHED